MDVAGFGDAIRTGLTDPERAVFEEAFTPGRNLLFLTLACSLAHTKGARTIVMGLCPRRQQSFPDQSERFLRAAERALSEAIGRDLSVVCPLREFSKADVVRLAADLGISRDHSCHAGTEVPCGKCIACLEYH